MARFPNSSYVDNTLYSLGWIYENVYFNKDSTLYYYNKIIKEYNNSDFTSVVKPIVENYEKLPEQQDSLNLINNDSLKTNTDSLNTKTDTEVKSNENTEDNKGQEEKLSKEEIEELLKKEDEIVPDSK